MNQTRADRLYDLKAKELDERAMALQKAEEECQRAVRHAADDYNNALVSYGYVVVLLPPTHLFPLLYAIDVSDKLLAHSLVICPTTVPFSSNQRSHCPTTSASDFLFYPPFHIHPHHLFSPPHDMSAIIS